MNGIVMVMVLGFVGCVGVDLIMGWCGVLFWFFEVGKESCLVLFWVFEFFLGIVESWVVVNVSYVWSC